MSQNPPRREELPRISDRISFLYVEHEILSRDSSAISLIADGKQKLIPGGQILVLMLGPGTSVTHDMIALAADVGMSIVWVGEQGIRFYAGGKPLSDNTRLLRKQAKIESSYKLRFEAIKRMYSIRYPDIDFSVYNRAREIFGVEGRRVYARYQELSKKYGVSFDGRDYDRENFAGNSPIQNALTCVNQCLYGICYAVIYSLGLSPGLGFMHSGNSKSFVLDIADLYKEKYAWEIAFKVVAEGSEDVAKDCRYKMRDWIKEIKLPELIVSDIMKIINDESVTVDTIDNAQEGTNVLWSGGDFYAEGGINYKNH